MTKPLKPQGRKTPLLTRVTALGLTLQDLAVKANISVSQLYLINRNPRTNVTVATMRKLWLAARLRPSEYLEVDGMAW